MISARFSGPTERMIGEYKAMTNKQRLELAVWDRGNAFSNLEKLFALLFSEEEELDADIADSLLYNLETIDLATKIIQNKGKIEE